MPNNLEELKKKRDQLTARIQQAEARERVSNKKLEDKIKILSGAAVLNYIRTSKNDNSEWLIKILDAFLTREKERKDVLGDNGLGSDALLRMMKGGKDNADQVTD
ncbi:hypothetical protein GXB82_21795 [Pseudomonas stutzeri]|nr:hypothetical protein [Stutzerimonas stutzeri]